MGFALLHSFRYLSYVGMQHYHRKQLHPPLKHTEIPDPMIALAYALVRGVSAITVVAATATILSGCTVSGVCLVLSANVVARSLHISTSHTLRSLL
jgi:hypothetical protein